LRGRCLPAPAQAAPAAMQQPVHLHRRRRDQACPSPAPQPPPPPPTQPRPPPAGSVGVVRTPAPRLAPPTRPLRPAVLQVAVAVVPVAPPRRRRSYCSLLMWAASRLAGWRAVRYVLGCRISGGGAGCRNRRRGSEEGVKREWSCAGSSEHAHICMRAPATGVNRRCRDTHACHTHAHTHTQPWPRARTHPPLYGATCAQPGGRAARASADAGDACLRRGAAGSSGCGNTQRTGWCKEHTAAAARMAAESCGGWVWVQRLQPGAVARDDAATAAMMR